MVGVLEEYRKMLEDDSQFESEEGRYRNSVGESPSKSQRSQRIERHLSF